MIKIDSFNFAGLKAIVRVDFNVPLNEKFEITDDTRIRAALPTIQKIVTDGGIAILMSHLGRPKNGPEDKYSLSHLTNHLSALLSKPVKFASDCIGDVAINATSSLQPGDVLLLENLRFYKQEEKGDSDFAKELASLADVYVNDAFGTAHRAHASTTIIANFFADGKKMFGFLMDKEVSNIDKVLFGAHKPFTAILGGAKVSSKITIIEKLLERVDNLIIGGGMMFTFIKAQGGNVGASLIEEEHMETALRVLEVAKQNGVTIHLAGDALLADRFANDAQVEVGSASSIEPGLMGLDIGPEAIADFSKVIKSSNTLLWNGPMGVFEMPAFEKGTKAVALAIAEATAKGAFSLVGGGDSVAAVNQLGLSDKVGYVSTGGGALLEYIEFQDLPGIKAIRG